MSQSLHKYQSEWCLYFFFGVSVAEGASAMINVDIFAKHSDVEIILQSFIGYTCVIWEHRDMDAHI